MSGLIWAQTVFKGYQQSTLVGTFSFKINFFENSFRNTIRVSNSWDANQAQLFVGSDLGPNCLQRLSADFLSKTFSKNSFRNNIRVSNSSDANLRPNFLSGLILIQTVCEGYQQTTQVGTFSFKINFFENSFRNTISVKQF